MYRANCNPMSRWVVEWTVDRILTTIFEKLHFIGQPDVFYSLKTYNQHNIQNTLYLGKKRLTQRAREWILHSTGGQKKQLQMCDNTAPSLLGVKICRAQLFSNTITFTIANLWGANKSDKIIQSRLKVRHMLAQYLKKGGDTKSKLQVINGHY